MTQISLSEAYRIIDEFRGDVLYDRKKHEKGTPEYKKYSQQLVILNLLKKEFALVSDADQLPLGL